MQIIANVEESKFEGRLDQQCLQEAAFYSAKHTSFDESHEVFRKAMPGGFSWEVTEVYSGYASLDLVSHRALIKMPPPLPGVLAFFPSAIDRLLSSPLPLQPSGSHIKQIQGLLISLQVGTIFLTLKFTAFWPGKRDTCWSSSHSIAVQSASEPAFVNQAVKKGPAVLVFVHI